MVAIGSLRGTPFRHLSGRCYILSQNRQSCTRDEDIAFSATPTSSIENSPSTFILSLFLSVKFVGGYSLTPQASEVKRTLQFTWIVFSLQGIKITCKKS
jgi:hypothetical protein